MNILIVTGAMHFKQVINAEKNQWPLCTEIDRYNSDSIQKSTDCKEFISSIPSSTAFAYKPGNCVFFQCSIDSDIPTNSSELHQGYEIFKNAKGLSKAG